MNLFTYKSRYKTEVMKERIKDINPECHVVEHRCFFLPENQDDFNFKDYNYVVDAVDTNFSAF